MASETDMGMYNAAFTMSRLLLVFYNSLTIAMFPAIASAIATGDVARSTRLIKQSHRFLLILVAPTSFFLAASSRTILRVFGAEYVGGSDAMVVLAFGFLGLAFLSMLNDIQLADRRFGKVIAVNLFAVAIEIALAVPLTRAIGLTGAALALAAACAFACVLQLDHVRRRFGPPLPIPSACRILAAAGVCAAALVPITSLWALLPAYAVAAACYGLLLTYLREMDVAEMRYWLAVLARKREPSG
jgi:O-antigen/teichoic acid export membrane protein